MIRWRFPGLARCVRGCAWFIAALASSFHAVHVGAMPSPAPAPKDAAFLFLFEDPAPPSMRSLLAANRETLQAARVALCEARWHEARRETSARKNLLQAGLPPALRPHLRVEALPSVAALLAFVPVDSAATAARAWQRPSEDPLLEALTLVSRLGDPAPGASEIPGAAARASGDSGASDNAAPCRGKASRAGRVLAIFDNGAAADHPWLEAGLGRLHFQPGTPGSPDTPGLRRSHGTAMLGIYAQAALGRPLTTDGAPLLPDLRQPIAISDTLIALAGPESPQGQVALARNLDWMLTAAGDRPFPDLLNYSQGNGPMCVPEETAGCADAGWAGISRLVDRASADYGVLIVKSAGNAGYAAAKTRVTVPGDSFNALVVGNMHAFDWNTCTPGGPRAQHRLHRQSSVGARTGPTLIDLVAPGVRIDTAGVDASWCEAVCEHAEACAFCRRLGHRRQGSEVLHKRNSGTSPAAALAGVAALRLMQSGLVSPLAMKAVLMNSAEAWDSHDTPVPDIPLADCGKVNSASPHGPAHTLVVADRQYGRGYLDAARALATAAHVVVDSLAADERRCFALTGEGPWKVTLTWAVQQMRVARPAHLALKDLRSGTAAAAGHSSDTTLQLGLSGDTDASPLGGTRAATARAPLIEITQRAPEIPETAAVFALAASGSMQRLPNCP